MGTPIYDRVEIVETKACRHCAQFIDVRAERYPYCEVVQQRPSNYVDQLRRLAPYVVFIFVGVGVVAYYMLYQDYQLVLDEPDPKVNGWLVDLERRVAAYAQR